MNYSLRLSAELAYAIERYYKLYDTPPDAVPTLSQEFMHEFKRAFLNLTNELGLPVVERPEEIISVSEEDLLKLREIVSIEESYGEVQSGILLHRRIYETLVAQDEEIVKVEIETEEARDDGNGNGTNKNANQDSSQSGTGASA